MHSGSGMLPSRGVRWHQSEFGAGDEAALQLFKKPALCSVCNCHALPCSYALVSWLLLKAKRPEATQPVIAKWNICCVLCGCPVSADGKCNKFSDVCYVDRESCVAVLQNLLFFMFTVAFWCREELQAISTWISCLSLFFLMLSNKKLALFACKMATLPVAKMPPPECRGYYG